MARVIVLTYKSLSFLQRNICFIYDGSDNDIGNMRPLDLENQSMLLEKIQNIYKSHNPPVP